MDCTVEFEQVNVGWVVFTSILLEQGAILWAYVKPKLIFLETNK